MLLIDPHVNSMKIFARVASWASLQEWVPLSSVLSIAGGISVLAIGSQIAIPFYPVPLTMQTFAAQMVAFSLPPGQALLTVLAWLTLGASGVPVLACLSGGAWVFWSMRGGYLWGMLLAIPLLSLIQHRGAGWLHRWIPRSLSKKKSPMDRLGLAGLLLIGSLGVGIILTMGWLQIRFLLGGDSVQAWWVGVYPFLLGETLKTVAAALSRKKLDFIRGKE